MATIDVHPALKDKLKKLKEEYGCKTYSEVINILLTKLEVLDHNVV